MSFTHPRLHNTILLLGNLLGALDKSSRETIGDILFKVARDALDPKMIKVHARRIEINAVVQEPITDNADLNRALTQPSVAQTQPADL